MIERFRLAFIFCVLVLTVDAQIVSRSDRFTLQGVVYEKKQAEPLPGAYVQLLDSLGHVVKAGTSQMDGRYFLSDVAAGNYRLRVSFLGFHPQLFQIKLSGRARSMPPMDVFLDEITVKMAETVVTAQVPEITMVDDTVMHHAAAYPVPEGAMVEELLKKIPGLDIDEYGKVTINGKDVSKILVDGKEFFGSDLEVTLKNLPADIVEKIKVYDKKSDNARITGIDDGNEKTVLDLSVKKGMKKGWFGQVSGGVGTHRRYSGKGNANRFTETQKYSVIGNANNTANGGNTQRQQLGFNFFLDRPDLETGGNFRIQHNGMERNTWVSSQSFENKLAAFSNRNQTNRNQAVSLGFDYRMEWRPDTMTTILFRPALNWNRNVSDRQNESASFHEDPYSFEGITDPLKQLDEIADLCGVNHNFYLQRGTGNNLSGNVSLQYNRKLGKKGRNVGGVLEGGWGQNDQGQDAYSLVDYYQLLAQDGGDSLYSKIQYNETQNHNYNWSARFNYSEPLNDHIFLQFTYHFRMRYQNNIRDVRSLFSEQIEELGGNRDNYMNWREEARPDTGQCQNVENRYYHHDVRLQLRVNQEKYYLTAGVNVQPQTSYTDYTKGEKHFQIGQTVVNMAPTADFRYRFTKQEQIHFTYRGNTGQPDILNLIPDTLENSNPLNIRLGNAALKPSFTHQISMNYNRFVQENQRSYTLSVNYRQTQNGVTQRTEYNDVTGGRVSKPENINGNWNASAHFNFNTALRNPRFRVNSNTRTNYTNAMGYVYDNDEQITRTNRTETLVVQQDMRGTYRNEWLECGLKMGARYNHSRSTARSAGNLDTYQYDYGVDVLFKLPWDMNISSDFSERSRRGYSDAAMNTDEWVWNIQISQSFLKRKAATVSLRFYDLLNQSSNVDRVITASSRRDTRYESVHSYCMLSFIYKINRFGKRR